MSKIVVIGDSHFGARNDNPLFLEYFEKFFSGVLFPYIKENKITRVIHLGDFMDRRKYVNFSTLHFVREKIVKPLYDLGVDVDIILGNHDVYYKNTNKVNSVQELFEHSEHCGNWHIHSKPVVLSDIDVALVPWITADNQQECLDFIGSNPASVLMGHFELSGYEVLRGTPSTDGMDPSLLASYEAVYSGHFHCRHSKNNVHYIGNPYQITFNDLHEPKGFSVFDTETREMEFIKNPHRIFTELVYDDEATDYYKQPPSKKTFKDTYVRIKVLKKTNPVMFERVVDYLNEMGCHGVSVADEMSDILSTEAIEQEGMKRDTFSLICDEVDGMKGVEDPSRLKNLLRELYMEAQQA